MAFLKMHGVEFLASTGMKMQNVQFLNQKMES